MIFLKLITLLKSVPLPIELWKSESLKGRRYFKVDQSQFSEILQ